MSAIILIIISMISINANAETFNSNVELCSHTEKLVFYSNGSMWVELPSGQGTLDGSYSIDYNYDESEADIRCDFTNGNSVYIHAYFRENGNIKMYFNGHHYINCNARQAIETGKKVGREILKSIFNR